MGKSVAAASEAATAGPHGQVRDEMVVHDVEVNHPRSAVRRAPYLVGQAREICRQDRRRADDRIFKLAEKPHLFSSHTPGIRRALYRKRVGEAEYPAYGLREPRSSRKDLVAEAMIRETLRCGRPSILPISVCERSL